MIAKRNALIGVVAFVLVALGLPGTLVVHSAPPAPIAVTSADPPTGEQGTLNLDVTIGGKNFKSGAKAQFFKTGTTDPAGVNVKATRYVTSTQLVATIDIADAAAIAGFDIQVQNTDGRTGKGTELFKVTEKGNVTPVYVADFVTFKADDPGWVPKIYGDGLGPYPVLVQPGYRLHLDALQANGRAIVFQHDNPYPVYQSPLICKAWGSTALYERAYPPNLLTADKVTIPPWTEFTTGYELTYDEAQGMWVRIVQSVSRRGDITYRIFEPFAMSPGQKSYATMVVYFRMDGEQGNFYVNFNDTFNRDLLRPSTGLTVNGGVVEVERGMDGETWSVRPISNNFPLLGTPPTVIPQYQVNFSLNDAPDTKADPGGNCDFGNFFMPFELKIWRVK